MRRLFESKRVAKMAVIFRPIAKIISVMVPNLAIELKQAEYKVKLIDFISISLFFSFVYSSLISLAFYLFIAVLSSSGVKVVTMSIIVFIVLFLSLLVNLLSTPRLYLLSKARAIDSSLLFALRHILIKVKSGIPLFNSMVGVAYGKYGAVSKEFRKFVKDVQGGESEISALERLSFYNPSSFFRRFIWQITNSLRAGGDVSQTLEVIVKSIEDDRYIKIKEFSNRLSPIALMYIMFTIIIPALGTTFLTVFSSFFGGKIPDYTFYFIPVIVIVSNLFFMMVIQRSRPRFEMS